MIKAKKHPPLNDIMVGFLTGSQVILNPLTEDHLDHYLEWWNHALVRKYARASQPVSVDTLKARFNQTGLHKSEYWFEIEKKSDSKLVGVGNLHLIDYFNRKAQMGITIGNPAYWKQGIGTEVALLLLKFGFEDLNLHKIRYIVLEGNQASIRIAEKLGFQFEGIQHDEGFIDGHYIDESHYALFQDYWLKELRHSELNSRGGKQ